MTSPYIGVVLSNKESLNLDDLASILQINRSHIQTNKNEVFLHSSRIYSSNQL